MVWSEACLALYLHQAMCFTACYVSRSSAAEHQPRADKQHYAFLIILNKYVDTNMTHSLPDDLWRMLWQLNRLLVSLFVLHTFGGSNGPANYRWQDRETCHLDVHDKWSRDSAAKHQPMNLKYMHTCMQWEQQNETELPASGGSFDKQTLQGEFIWSCKWRDGS